MPIIQIYIFITPEINSIFYLKFYLLPWAFVSAGESSYMSIMPLTGLSRNFTLIPYRSTLLNAINTDEFFVRCAQYKCAGYHKRYAYKGKES